MVYVPRKDASSTEGALQIRYDQNHELKNLLKDVFSESYQYIIHNRVNKQKRPVNIPENQAEYIDFYQTEQPFLYKVEFIVKKTQYIPTFWWVNQGQSVEAEVNGSFLWAPKQNKNGRPLAHHVDLLKANEGDIVFAYSKGAINYICVVEKKAISSPKPSTLSQHGWEEEGNLVKVKYYSLNRPIQKDELPLDWRLDETGPFDKNGNVKQGYFYSVGNQFVDHLISSFVDRIPNELKGILKSKNEHQEDMPMVTLNEEQLIDHIFLFIQSKGYFYQKTDIKNLFLSLKTKPFVILSGISGTGKTKIVQLFAESLGATTDNGQFLLIPVRPDWSDGSDLIGYVDLTGEFKPGPLAKILRDANQPENRDKPYFILLDEMNLARVEYYLSDLLSIMETKKWKDGKIVSDPVLNRNGYENLMLLDNVYMIGTVNMDETTYPFSKKVLDRANTIEYNEVFLDKFDFFEKEFSEVQPIVIKNEQLAGNLLNMKDAYIGNETLIKEVTVDLVRINSILKENQCQFAYRVRDEICFYMIYNEKARLLKRDDAFDFQLMQKILPRIAGTDETTANVLKRLFEICTNHTWSEAMDSAVIQEARFPKSAEKIRQMIRKIESEGFASYWNG